MERNLRTRLALCGDESPEPNMRMMAGDPTVHAPLPPCWPLPALGAGVRRRGMRLARLDWGPHGF